MNKLNHRKNYPEWYKFITENIDLETRECLNPQHKEFWDDVLLKRKKKVLCSCGNNETDPHSYCIKCWLMNPKAIWRWSFTRRGGFLCYEIALLDKIYVSKFNGKRGLDFYITSCANILETFRWYFYNLQNKMCKECGKMFEIKQMDLHHKIPVSFGGRESEDNLIMLCKECHKKYKGESYHKKNGN